MENLAAKAPVATFMQQLQCNLWFWAAKRKSITHAPAAAMKLDAAIPLRSAETELQNAKELRTTAAQIAAPKPDRDAHAQKRRFWFFF